MQWSWKLPLLCSYNAVIVAGCSSKGDWDVNKTKKVDHTWITDHCYGRRRRRRRRRRRSKYLSYYASPIRLMRCKTEALLATHTWSTKIDSLCRAWAETLGKSVIIEGIARLTLCEICRGFVKTIRIRCPLVGVLPLDQTIPSWPSAAKYVSYQVLSPTLSNNADAVCYRWTAIAMR